MVNNENRKDAGIALEAVVYDILSNQFGHNAQFRQAKMRYNREGSKYPTVFGEIDGMIKWNGVPHLLEIKTTTEKNYDYILAQIQRGKTCDSLESYTNQLRKYAALIKYGECEDWTPPSTLTLEMGVLAIMNRNTSQVSMRQVRLFDRTPSRAILESAMRELEERYGVGDQEVPVVNYRKRARPFKKGNGKLQKVAYRVGKAFAKGFKATYS